jgi:hypothetical protein
MLMFCSFVVTATIPSITFVLFDYRCIISIQINSTLHDGTMKFCVGFFPRGKNPGIEQNSKNLKAQPKRKNPKV